MVPSSEGCVWETIPQIEEITIENLGNHLWVRKKDGWNFLQKVCTTLSVESSNTLDSMESNE